MPPKDKDSDQDTPEDHNRSCIVRRHFEIEFEDNGEKCGGFDAPLEWKGIPYYAAVAMEIREAQSLLGYTEFGRNKVEAMGDGPKLRMLLGEDKPEELGVRTVGAL